MTFQSITPLTGALLGLAALALVLPGCAVFGVRKTPEPYYKVVTEKDEIEVRRYESMILAQTTVTNTDFDGSSNVAFRRLFNYISGENSSADKIAMTAPVIQEEAKQDDGQKIAMTAPVIQEEAGQGAWNMAFVLPSSFTMENAPRPTNPEVKLVEKQARHVATITFSGSRDESRYNEHASQLETWLTKNGYEILSEPRYAGYDPPYTLPMMRRNEVLIDVKPPRE